MSLAAARAANAAALSSSSHIPVAIFLGGTSGIGQGTAEAFARHTQGNAHIIICGRNRTAAETIIETFPKPNKGKYEFVQCDATLMKNVQTTTSALLSSLPKLNYLVMTSGFMTLKGRDETTEGIDKKLAVHYYARWKFAHDLMPLLRKAKDAGEDAKVLSVLGAGYGGAIDLDDLGLKKGYSVGNAALAAPTYNDLMIEVSYFYTFPPRFSNKCIQSFSEAHPDMAFTHTSPGIVLSSLVKFDHWALKPLLSLIKGLLYPFSYSIHDSGEQQLHNLLAGENGSFRRGPKGGLATSRLYSTEEARKRLWEHTVEATRVE